MAVVRERIERTPVRGEGEGSGTFGVVLGVLLAVIVGFIVWNMIDRDDADVTAPAANTSTAVPNTVEAPTVFESTPDIGAGADTSAPASSAPATTTPAAQ